MSKKLILAFCGIACLILYVAYIGMSYVGYFPLLSVAVLLFAGVTWQLALISRTGKGQLNWSSLIVDALGAALITVVVCSFMLGLVINVRGS